MSKFINTEGAQKISVLSIICKRLVYEAARYEKDGKKFTKAEIQNILAQPVIAAHHSHYLTLNAHLLGQP